MKNEPRRPIGLATFHGEVWQKCPKCNKAFEFWDINNEKQFKHLSGRIYIHKRCGQMLDMS